MMDNMAPDTIAAIATPLGNAGVGIIRVSGSNAISVVDPIFKGKNKEKNLFQVPSHTVQYGLIQDGEEILDEVLVLVMRGPHSYTAEDTVEIDCHGGALVMKKILEAVIRHGARLADPGEFTKRAYLNGKMDLSQAEAVMDLICSQNEYALKSSVRQLRGSLSRKVKKLREDILYQMAYIESALDDPEHISLDGYRDTLLTLLGPMMVQLEELVHSADQGKIISEGIRTVILGKPNAGKSSLMNVLVGEERAIVTDVAGTTRDTLEEPINLGGIQLKVVDTAGIRETEDAVERIGITRAKNAADDADLIIYVVDGSCPLDDNDQAIIELIQNKKALVLLNKTDLDLLVEEKELEKKTGHPVISVSAKEEKGIEKLEKRIHSMFFSGEIDFNNQLVITNVRHKTALTAAFNSLNLVKNGITEGIPEDFLTIDLMDAYGHLGVILGEEVRDDLVQEIFSKFCMGK